MEDECLGQLLSVVSFLHLRQNNIALLTLLDKPVKRIMVQIIELHTLANPAHFHQQRRVADLAFQQYLY